MNDTVTPVSIERLAAELDEINGPAIAAPMTATKMRQALRELEALGVTTTDELTVLTVARYIASRPTGQSPYTLKSMLSTLRTACSYAEASGYLRVSPFKFRKLSKWVRCTPPGTSGIFHGMRSTVFSSG